MVAFVKRLRTTLRHHKMMMTCAVYRLVYSTQTIHALPIWQNVLETTPMKTSMKRSLTYVLSLDECAMLQIAEAKDVPYEVWNELIKHKPEVFQGLSERVGTRKHDATKCVRMALDFFIDRYCGSHCCGPLMATKHAQAIIEDAGLCMPPLFVGIDDLLKQ